MQEKMNSNTKIKINDISLERLQFDTLYSQEMQEYDENPEQFTPWFQQKNKADSLKHQLEGQNHKFFAKIKFTSKQTSIISEPQRLVAENQSKALQYLKRNLTNKLSREGVRQISQKYHSLSPPAKFIEKRRNLYRKSKIGTIYHKPKMIDLKLGSYQKQLQQNEAESLLRSGIKNKKSFKISQKKQITPFSAKEDPHPRLENYDILRAQKKFMNDLQHIVHGQSSPQKRGMNKILTNTRNITISPITRKKNLFSLSPQPQKYERIEEDQQLACQGKNLSQMQFRKNRIRQRVFQDRKEQHETIFLM